MPATSDSTRITDIAGKAPVAERNGGRRSRLGGAGGAGAGEPAKDAPVGSAPERIPLYRQAPVATTAELHDDRATMTAVTEAEVRSARLSPWAPLRHKVFAALFAAQLGSNIGTFFQTVAAAWLMGDLTPSPTLVALIQTASLLPLLLLGLPAGALADIFDRRLLLIATQAWMLVCAGVLAALTMTDHVTPATLLGLTFALGVGTALMGPAWQAIQPDLVPPREFSQAVALSSLTFNTGRAIGPALAGRRSSRRPQAGWAFVVNAASFLGVIVVLLWWRPHRTSVRLSTESLAGRCVPACATA